MAKRVRFRVVEGIAVITLDAPPVNALSLPVRTGLWDALGRLESDAGIVAAVLVASGRMFSAGADLGEFGQPPGAPSLSQVCNRIEACCKPVVVAVHGRALGGGAELALAAHYRLTGPDARIGLPEVALGLLPGAGGTQRLPRLIGAERALQMMISTNAIDAGSALRSGLVDHIVEGDLASGATRFAQDLVASGEGPRPTRSIRTHLQDARAFQDVIGRTRTALAHNPLHAPQRVLDCVEAAGVLPFDAALALEEDAFERCLAHPQSIALRHVFKAERAIDDALIERAGTAFKPVEPMGKAVVVRLRAAMRAAAEHLVEHDAFDAAQIDAAMRAYGFRKGPFGGQETGAPQDGIARRIVAAMMAEGARCVEEQAVQRPSDIDVLAVHGMGFPRRHGGPMRATQTMGLVALRTDMRSWTEARDIWGVPDLVDEAIKHAAGFDALAEQNPDNDAHQPQNRH